jgi:hypothetical protein
MPIPTDSPHAARTEKEATAMAERWKTECGPLSEWSLIALYSLADDLNGMLEAMDDESGRREQARRRERSARRI